MDTKLRIGLIGDQDYRITAHRAIPLALSQASPACALQLDWLHTEDLAAGSGLDAYDGFWCIPGSPYRSTDGALRAIEHARRRQVPFLGTCGGFQHALLERARNVLGWEDAGHAELEPESPRAVVSALPCSLVEVSETIFLQPGSHLGRSYGTPNIREQYRCSFGVNPAYQAELLGEDLVVTARSVDGRIRGFEAASHPFFVATLFQPERRALSAEVVPLAHAFMDAAVAHANTRRRSRA